MTVAKTVHIDLKAIGILTWELPSTTSSFLSALPEEKQGALMGAVARIIEQHTLVVLGVLHMEPHKKGLLELLELEDFGTAVKISQAAAP